MPLAEADALNADPQDLTIEARRIQEPNGTWFCRDARACTKFYGCRRRGCDDCPASSVQDG
jgi:hypothetical protein